MRHAGCCSLRCATLCDSVSEAAYLPRVKNTDVVGYPAPRDALPLGYKTGQAVYMTKAPAVVTGSACSARRADQASTGPARQAG